MSKRQTAILGAAGEHFVLSQLLGRGFTACLAPQNAATVDILIVRRQNIWACWWYDQDYRITRRVRLASEHGAVLM